MRNLSATIASYILAASITLTACAPLAIDGSASQVADAGTGTSHTSAREISPADSVHTQDDSDSPTAANNSASSPKPAISDSAEPHATESSSKQAPTAQNHDQDQEANPAQTFTYEQISDFVASYFAATTEAFETLDTSKIEVTSSESCDNCTQTIQTIASARGATFPVTNVAVMPAQVLDIWQEEQDYFHVEFDADVFIARSNDAGPFQLEKIQEGQPGYLQIMNTDNGLRMLSYGPAQALDIPMELLLP